MDAANLAMVAAAFAASCVAQKCADAALDAGWGYFKRVFAKYLRREPVPKDLTDHQSLPDDLLSDEGLAVLTNDILASSPALRRADVVRRAVSGARMLWVDDIPISTSWERALFELLGAEAETAESTASALERLAASRFDLILSDIARGDNPRAGLETVHELRRLAPGVPIIFYVGRLDADKGPPPGAYGITNQPEELIHLVLDVLERRRL